MSTQAKPMILVVDDDAMNREVLEAFLLSENYDVLLAHNGETALELAAAYHPNLILLDVRMGDISGYEVCQRLKAAPRTAQIPIVIITGYDGPEDQMRSRVAGAEGFLSRPFKADFLLELVRQFLNGAAHSHT